MGKGVVQAAVAAVAVIATLIWIGCGGGGDSGSLTKAEFAKQAKAICTKAAAEKEEVIAKAAETLPKKVTDAVKEEVVLEATRPYEKATQKLADLGLPEGQEQKAEAMIESREEAAEKLQASPTTALVSDLPVRKANKTAEDFGLDDCRF